MNIFVLDTVARSAAQAHCDKHVVKMVMETAQLLCTAHHVLGVEKHGAVARLLKPTHMNHPCAVWARECSGNYEWLQTLGVALADEYTYRYGRVHAYDALLREVLCSPPRAIKTQRRKPFIYCGPDEHRQADIVASYRRYYVQDKSRFAKWTHRPAPRWMPLTEFWTSKVAHVN